MSVEFSFLNERGNDFEVSRKFLWGSATAMNNRISIQSRNCAKRRHRPFWKNGPRKKQRRLISGSVAGSYRGRGSILRGRGAQRYEFLVYVHAVSALIDDEAFDLKCCLQHNQNAETGCSPRLWDVAMARVESEIFRWGGGGRNGLKMKFSYISLPNSSDNNPNFLPTGGG